MTPMQTQIEKILQEQREREEIRETTEFVEDLKLLTEKEKQQIKGIIIGMRLAKINTAAND